MQIVPLTNHPNQVHDTELGGAQVSVAARWNVLIGAWFIDFESPRGTPVIQGRRLSSYVGLLPTTYPGQLVAVPVLPGNDEAPARQAWTETHSLIFFNAAESEGLFPVG